MIKPSRADQLTRMIQRGGLAAALFISFGTAVFVHPAVAQTPPLTRASINVPKVIRDAEAGNAKAQTQLGYMHQFGNGVAQDYLVAAVWYKRAAAQGEPLGQYYLGHMYDKGLGVPVDYIEAYKWLNLATSRAHGRDRDLYVRIRDAVGSKLSFPELQEAQLRTRQWFAVPERRRP